MRKTIIWEWVQAICLPIILAILVGFSIGCGKSDAVSSDSSAASDLVPPDPVDLTEVRKAFETASPAIRVYFDETVSLIRGRLFKEAVEQCQKLQKNASLTPEQRKALQELQTKLLP